jgi:hypothetical protein
MRTSSSPYTSLPGHHPSHVLCHEASQQPGELTVYLAWVVIRPYTSPARKASLDRLVPPKLLWVDIGLATIVRQWLTQGRLCPCDVRPAAMSGRSGRSDNVCTG